MKAMGLGTDSADGGFSSALHHGLKLKWEYAEAKRFGSVFGGRRLSSGQRTLLMCVGSGDVEDDMLNGNELMLTRFMCEF